MQKLDADKRNGYTTRVTTPLPPQLGPNWFDCGNYMLPKRTDRAVAGEVVIRLYLKLDFCRLPLTCHGISSFCRIQSVQLRVVVNQRRLCLSVSLYW